MAANAPSLPTTIKSVQYTAAGTPAEILSINEAAPLPTVSGSNILIKVHAAALNPVDWKLMKGGFVPRFLMPSVKVPALDVAGTVVALGPKAGKHVKIGDQVLAMLHFSVSGGLTEYTIVDESLAVKKPERWSFEQAAAVPLVATTVWHALVFYGKLKKGDKVLINGASGGTGTVAVQLAKALGAYVVGVCSTANVQLVKDIGADEVVDYKTTDVTEKYTSRDFDLVFDTVGTAAEIWAKRKTLIKSSGNLVRIAGDDHALDSPFHMVREGAKIGSEKFVSLLQWGPGYHLFTCFPNGSELTKAVQALSDAGADPVIDSVQDFKLPSILTAFDKSISSRAKGKLVIRIV